MPEVRDGLSNTLLIGERNSEVMHSSWTGAVTSSPYHFWLTFATAQFPPNYFENQPKDLDFVFDPGFSSKHPGITMMSFADGAVVPIPDSIDAKLFYELATSSGKEIAGNGDWEE